MCVSVLCEATLSPKSPCDRPLGCVLSRHCKFGGTRWKEMAGLLEISTACNSVFCFPNTTTYTYKERVFTGGLTWKENSHSSTSAFSISQCSFWWLELVCVVFWAAVKYSEKFCCSQGQLNTLAFFFFLLIQEGIIIWWSFQSGCQSLLEKISLGSGKSEENEETDLEFFFSFFISVLFFLTPKGLSFWQVDVESSTSVTQGETGKYA